MGVSFIMDRSRPAGSLKRKGFAPCVGSLEAYREASAPSKLNTIYGCTDETFLKEIYAIEKNAEWRKMCLTNILDQDFLEYVARNDTNERVRKQAAIRCKKNSLISWLQDHDHSELVRNYAQVRYAKLPNSVKFIVD